MVEVRERGVAMRRIVLALFVQGVLVTSAFAEIPDGRYELTGKREVLVPASPSCGKANSAKVAKGPPRLEIGFGTGYVLQGKMLTSVDRESYDDGATSAFQWEQGLDGYEIQITVRPDGTLEGTYGIGRVKDGQQVCIDGVRYSAVAWTPPPPLPPLLPEGWTDLPTQGAALTNELKKSAWKCLVEPGIDAKTCKSCRRNSLRFPCVEVTVTDGAELGTQEDGVLDHLYMAAFDLSAKGDGGKAVDDLIAEWGSPAAVAGSTIWAACWRRQTWSTAISMSVLKGPSLGSFRLLVMPAASDACATTDNTANQLQQSSPSSCSDPVTDFRSSADHLRRCGTGAAVYYFGGKNGLYRTLLTCENSQCSSTAFVDTETSGANKVISDGEFAGTLGQGEVVLSHELESGFARPASITSHWAFSDGGLVVSVSEQSDLPDRRGNFKISTVKFHGTWFDCSVNAMCMRLMKRVPQLLPKPVRSGASTR
jgi:hypothetical protein